MGLNFRKKSGKIANGSRLIVPGQQYLGQKVFEPTFKNKKSAPIDRDLLEQILPFLTPPPTPSVTPTNTPTNTPQPSQSPTNTPTPTQTPTNTPTPTQTPTNTPTPTPTPPIPFPPTNISIPVVSGVNSVGSVLFTTNGTWTNSPTSYTYQWYSLNYSGGSPTLLTGATNSSYLLTQSEANTYVYCEVTAINLYGSGVASSSNSSNYIYDNDYYAIYTGYTIGPPSVGQSILQNQLMLGVKSSGAWVKLDYFIVCATDGDEFYALTDWKTNTRNSVAYSGYTFISNQGFSLDGVSGYIDTQFNPFTSGVNYQTLQSSRYFMPYSVTSGVFDGVLTTPNPFINSIQLGNVVTQRINQGPFDLNTAFNYLNDPSGPKNIPSVKSIQRLGNSSLRLSNGTSITARLAFVTSVQNSNQLIGRSGINFGNHIVAGYAMGGNLVSQNTAFVTAWNTYINAI